MMARRANHSHHTGGHRPLGFVSTLLPLLLFAGLCTLWPHVVRGEIYCVQWSWAPSLDLYLRFRLDGLSLLFGLIVTGAGVLVTLFASSYMAGHAQTGRFFFFLQAFMLAMLGIVMADNLLLLFVFWEATTVFSYLLIGFDHESETARFNARQAILVTGAGGLALLVGILLLKTAGGPMTLSQWTASDPGIRQHPLYPAIFILFLLGAMTKSAQVPFHFWLPNAMSAPTPISAFLHAATMVKAGIYLLMRLHPLLGGTPMWMGSLVIIGGVTALWGALQSLSPCDLKRMLAYTTVMALGTLTMFLGGSSIASLTAAATFLLVHALYKAALFLAVGSIDHQTGTRRRDRLAGLWRAMPLTAIAVAAATLSMAGFPLFFGFIGKEIMYQGALAEKVFPHFATTIALLSNALMTAVAGIILIGPFGGKRPDDLADVEEAPWPMRLGPGIMGGLCLLFGIIPGWVSASLIQPAVGAFFPVEEKVHLALFHGFNLPLLLSVLTLTLGSGIYFLRRPIGDGLTIFLDRLPVTARHGYDWFLRSFLGIARWTIGGLQNGSLHRYLLITIGVFTLTTITVWWFHGGSIPVSLPLPDLPLSQWLLAAVMTAAVVAVVMASSRILAVCALGVVGGGAALVFLVYGAPDLALTQLLVETLTLIIVSIVLLRLPPLDARKLPASGRRWLDGMVSVATGVLVAALCLAATNGPVDRQLTAFFEENSYIAAHGRNIVNVILVDFRSLDTLGEIVVVATAGLAGYALIARRQK
ncbi:Na(+)/H(+) antiporter subunit A [Desulfosarcina widdelii]|uniref:Na(+)/H(+) antiporter subunit A n=1 Tax=Desulfosarcina widdelii TaxID=947919 RepID=A0A5K7ZIM9_9BACT|nr:hydrogen gas-evolving membrane-bound hydrogenase subunit E [Desulfosarcina widdelii]BBO75917.1 Na(+)/H(+) antiporter subunit A [Desulfosarcina widdelii]